MIEKKGFNPNTNYFCSGNVEFGNRKFHCWKEGGHGNLNLRGAIKESCDCYFYNLAKKIKIDELAEFSKKFSLGLPTRVDIPNELSGIMPNRKWKKLNKGESWQRGRNPKYCDWSRIYVSNTFANFINDSNHSLRKTY